MVLAKTVKGYGMGPSGEAQNITHQQKKMDVESIRLFRDRFNVPVPDEQLEEVPYYHPGADSRKCNTCWNAAKALGGPLPERRHDARSRWRCRSCRPSSRMLKSTGEREISTTMAFVRSLAIMLRDKEHLADRIVPIVADEARTFGMEGMFRQLGIYSAKGQLYEPVDSDQLMFYKEDQKGQILQEGITEAGAMSSWIAAATSYSTSGEAMIPFYIYYSMFGFQRIGDLAWAAGDHARARFPAGWHLGPHDAERRGPAARGRPQPHAVRPSCPTAFPTIPTFAFEVAVILQDGLRRMYAEREDVYYYITLLNENYGHPAMPEGAEEGIRKGLYLLRDGGEADTQGPVAGQRRHPAGSHGRGRHPGRRPRRGGGYLERHQFQRAAPRWRGG